MELVLNAHEARVLGVLIEKGFTTPDQYPLSLNAATNGSNQKSCRDPKTDFTEAEVTVALQGLRAKHLAGASFPAGGRVEKWRHSAGEHLGLGERELAVLAELLLRGPQAPGGLRSNANRMRAVPDQEQLAQALATLTEKGFATRLGPAPGSRTERWGQTLAPTLHPGGEPPAPAAEVAGAAGAPSPPSSALTGMPTRPAQAPQAPRAPQASDRVGQLEERVARLERQLAKLAETLGESLES